MYLLERDPDAIPIVTDAEYIRILFEMGLMYAFGIMVLLVCVAVLILLSHSRRPLAYTFLVALVLVILAGWVL